MHLDAIAHGLYLNLAHGTPLLEAAVRASTITGRTRPKTIENVYTGQTVWAYAGIGWSGRWFRRRSRCTVIVTGFNLRRAPLIHAGIILTIILGQAITDGLDLCLRTAVTLFHAGIGTSSISLLASCETIEDLSTSQGLSQSLVIARGGKTAFFILGFLGHIPTP